MVLLKKIVILLLFFFIFIFLTFNKVEAFQIQSLKGTYNYYFWEPDEFNKLMEKANERVVNDHQGAEEFFTENIFLYEDLNEEDFKELDFAKKINYAGKINNINGYQAGIQFKPVSILNNIMVEPEISYEAILIRNDMYAEITDTHRIENEDNDIEITINSKFETELTFDIHGISLSGRKKISGNSGFQFGPLIYWAEGMIVHNKEFIFYYDIREVEEDLEDILVEIPENENFESKVNLKATPSIGWKFQLFHDLIIHDNVILNTSLFYRNMNMNVNVDEYIFAGEKDINEYLDDDILQELDQDFEKDLNNSGLSLTISIVF